MFQDILEDSWFLEEYVNKGIAQGIEQEKQMELQRFRQMVREVVQMRFPELASLAVQQAEKLDNPDVLQHLTMELFGAADVNEARDLLLHINGIGEYH